VQWPLLNVLTEPERRDLIKTARRRRFTRNEVIFHEGDIGDSLLLMSKGHVAIRMHTPLGDVATVRILRPGEFFGELAVISPGPRNASAIALDSAEALSVGRSQLDSLRREHPQIERVLVEALIAEVRRLSQRLVDAMYVPVEKRLWRRLAELGVIFGSDDVPATTIPLTQETLAQLVGCTRPTANRVMREGEVAGAIAIARGRLEILDPAAIERRGR